MLILVLSTLQASATTTDTSGISSREYTKSINKLYKVSSTGDVRLNNRYGNIDYTVWDKSEVKISITIEVDAASEAKAQAIFDRISIDFDASPSFVSATTEIESNNNWSWNGSGGKFEIHYAVSAPKNFNLELSNKYGNTKVPNLDGNATFDISYGDINAGNIRGNTSLEVAYGNASIGKLGELSTAIKYSKVKIASAANAKIDSRYSETSLGRVNKLILDSRYDEFSIGAVRKLINAGKYDDFKIDSVWSLSLQTQYTDMRIGYLADEANIQMRYGEVDIIKTSMALKSLRLEGSYTDMSVNLDPNLQYQLDAEGRYAQVNVPAAMKVVRKEVSGNTQSLSGHTGNGGKTKISMIANYGSIRVR